MASSTYQNIIRNLKKRAKAEGKAEGEQAKSEKFITNLIQSTEIDDVKVASLADVTLDFVKNMREKLQKKD